uniref:Large ribosomal subunit protein bL32c n=1 Tax=Ginkgo biloba TaxID=3311 RepID=I6N9K4_GINBI|nr:ribosomal protein L32 [Ginkgo biloba]
MAVPKKRTSKSRKRIRRNVWKGNANLTALKAFSLAESISTGHSKCFYCTTNNEPSGSSKSTLINELNDS